MNISEGKKIESGATSAQLIGFEQESRQIKFVEGSCKPATELRQGKLGHAVTSVFGFDYSLQQAADPRVMDGHDLGRAPALTRFCQWKCNGTCASRVQTKLPRRCFKAFHGPQHAVERAEEHCRHAE